jgi:hypothetical protein
MLSVLLFLDFHQRFASLRHRTARFTAEMPDTATTANVTTAARLKMVGPSTRRAANFLKRGRLPTLWPNAYLLDAL